MNGKQRVIAIVLAVNSFACMGDFFIMSPALSSLYDLFPDANMTLLGMILTISSLAVLTASLLTPLLEKHFKLKTLLVCGNIIFLVGGFACAFSSTFEFMLCMRLAEGFGTGMVITSSTALIAVLFYDDEQMRNKTMGLTGAFTSVFGFCLSLASGYFGTISWQLPFYLYLFNVAIIVLDLLFVPCHSLDDSHSPVNGGYLENLEFVGESGSRPHRRLSKSAVFVCIEGFAFAIMTSAFFVYISQYVVETGTGDSSLSGAILAAETLAAFPMGLALSYLMRRFGSAVPLIAWAIMLIGRFILQFLDVNMVFGLAAGLVFGLGYGLFYPWLYAKAAEVSEPFSEALTEGVVAGTYYLGTFASAFVVDFFGSLVGDHSAVFAMRFVFICCIMMTVVTAIVALAKACENKKERFRNPIRLNENN